MANVKLKSAYNAYGAAAVLHGVSSDIPDGEFVASAGPSECGKSTLLRMRADLENITGGEIRIGRRVQMRSEIRCLYHCLKNTTVYVTHDQVEAKTMAEKIIVMHDGIFEQVGAPLKLYDTPANIFAVSFMSSPAMNFLRGRIEHGRFVLGDGAALPLQPKSDYLPSENVIYGVRLEDFVMSDDRLPPTVAVAEPTGSETHAIARRGSHNTFCIFRNRTLPQVGETIRVKPDVSRIQLFSESDGLRLQ